MSVPMLESRFNTQPLEDPRLERVVLVKVGEPTSEGEVVLMADQGPISI